jgi:hypothetical protein
LYGGRSGLFQTTLRPPTLVGDAGNAQVRWLVTLPASVVVLAPESGLGRTWERRGWLLAPRLTAPVAGADGWLSGGEASATEDGAVNVVYDGVSGAPLTVTHAPLPVWLLACSAALAALGFGLYLLARPGPDGRGSIWLWPAVVLLASGVLLGALLWPDVTAQAAYGAEPGAVVVLIAALVWWVLHSRYRRQVIFLPSFSRSRGGSSLSRNGSKPPGEPSTVDVPRTGSSNRPAESPPAQ